MRHFGVILVIFLSILCMTSPAFARGSSFTGSGSINWPNLQSEVVTDDQGNTAISLALVLNGDLASTKSPGTTGGASVKQDVKARGSAIVVRSTAINSSGSIASTIAMSSGNATMETHQAAGSDDFGSTADQTTLLDLTNGFGYMGTSVNDKNDLMSTDFSVMGTGKISTDQSGVVGASSEYSTIKIKQFSDISLESGQAHSSMSSPTGFITAGYHENLYGGASIESDKQLNRVVNSTNYHEDSMTYVAGFVDGWYNADGDIYVHSIPPEYQSFRFQIDGETHPGPFDIRIEFVKDYP